MRAARRCSLKRAHPSAIEVEQTSLVAQTSFIAAAPIPSGSRTHFDRIADKRSSTMRRRCRPVVTFRDRVPSRHRPDVTVPIHPALKQRRMGSRAARPHPCSASGQAPSSFAQAGRGRLAKREACTPDRLMLDILGGGQRTDPGLMHLFTSTDDGTEFSPGAPKMGVNMCRTSSCAGLEGICRFKR